MMCQESGPVEVRDILIVGIKTLCVSYSGSGFHCPNVNFNLQERVDHKRFKNVTSWGACSNICRERPFCKYWVWHDATKVELQTMVQEYFIIMENIPIRAFSWLRAPTSVANSHLRH